MNINGKEETYNTGVKALQDLKSKDLYIKGFDVVKTNKGKYREPISLNAKPNNHNDRNGIHDTYGIYLKTENILQNPSNKKSNEESLSVINPVEEKYEQSLSKPISNKTFGMNLLAGGGIVWNVSK